MQFPTAIGRRARIAQPFDISLLVVVVVHEHAVANARRLREDRVRFDAAVAHFESGADFGAAKGVSAVLSPWHCEVEETIFDHDVLLVVFALEQAWGGSDLGVADVETCREAVAVEFESL